ncbi:LLM class flavin-dependent oxidoreductase [Yinghuangia sp. ASG 101]|uniref:LLM class flavin-dependent oxidoreductase n=1 Tax=Yinghuangia sp. ASG 101 TaxID=2896848 RepID=UPI001E5B37CC|nr:LLM class flavin-dependent oxidoreductase [Yinghuangia sp. ASG 101]UGQ12400.1 LLM class flavin-dependent oxidoreductase [Yinghuangia sp. ASG 101]
MTAIPRKTASVNSASTAAPRRVPISVLDLSPVMGESSAAEALRNTVDLARRVEAFGYHRFWVTEHHNTPGVASCSPPVLIGRLADETNTLRVGSGGVMLPNHPPLAVAEQFGTLEALHGDRIDLGIGRAPGTDAVTALALNRSVQPLTNEEFPRQVDELMGYFQGDVHGIVAVPAADRRVPIWMLGGSPNSARLAGRLGLPFAVAHHLRTEQTEAAFHAYREAFRPERGLTEPYALVCAMVVAAETDADAERLIRPVRLSMLRERENPRVEAYPSQDAADRYEFTDADREFTDAYLGAQIIGGRETVAAKTTALLERTGADEVMALTLIHDHEERVRSYEVFADVTAGLPAADTRTESAVGS